MTRKSNHDERGDWLEQAYPQMHYMLQAIAGDEPALVWLEQNSKGVSNLVRAMNGTREALADLNCEAPTDLDDLFEVIDNEDLLEWLKERQPDVHLLFEAIKGDEESAARLKRKHPRQAKLALAVRHLHERYQQGNANGNGAIEGSAAADVRCLVGEMHLKNGAYERAIEAFTRAIETEPTPDVYEGRARAYRGLAAEDERRAAELRLKP